MKVQGVSQIPKPIVVVRSYEDLHKQEEVVSAMNQLDFISKPTIEIAYFLNHVATMYQRDLQYLEKCMTIFIGYQNFYGSLLAQMEIIRGVADSQLAHTTSVLMGTKDGTLNERKDAVRASDKYRQAEEVYNKANGRYIMLKSIFESCDRAYKLASRILTVRLGIKEL
jgi:hypothetical protein